MADSPENDPKTIWQNQPTEPSAMTLDKIRQKVRELHAKTRRQLLGNLAVPLCCRRLLRFRHENSHFSTACNRYSRSPSPGAWPDCIS